MSVGKTTLARCLRDRLGAEIVAAREILAEMGAERGNREELQRLGALLEGQTSGQWLVDGVVSRVSERIPLYVVDSVRTSDQASRLRSRFHCHHIHLTAGEAELRGRFSASAEGRELTAAEIEHIYDHPVERASERVGKLADVSIDTSVLSAAQVCSDAIAGLKSG